ncbi:MAG: head-tail adaptor protein [Burkholderiales bacterium]|nr:head-tail adaptor protein [Burkholderiales bacterium]
MRAGQLRHFITFERQADDAGDLGNADGCWIPVYQNVPASIITLQGREAEQAHQVAAFATHTIKCRWLPDITEDMQIRFECRTFGIGSIQTGDKTMDNRQLGLTLLVSEKK